MATPEVAAPEITVDEIPENSVDKKIAPAKKEEEVPTKETKIPATEIPESTKEELFDEIDAVEGDERGKFSLKVGDSTYWGNTKKEVIQNLVKGKEEQDGYIRKVKASEKIKVPRAEKEEEVVPVALPSEQDIYIKHLEAVTKRNKIDANMLNWKDEDWNKYQDDNGLRDWQISRLQNQKDNILREVDALTAQDMKIANQAWVNNYTIESETKAIREMVAASGMNIDDFDWKLVYETAMGKIGSDGELKPGTLTAEAGKHITKVMRQGTAIKKDLTSIIDKGKEAKKEIKSPPNVGKVDEKDNGKVPSYDELGRQEKKALGRSGRDI